MMKKYILFCFLFCPVFFLVSKTVSAQSGTALDTTPIVSIRRSFLSPPESARPWVYWFWVNGNVSRKGITADLEAMKRVGIGGVLIMDVNLKVLKDGTPLGPMTFMDKQWQEMFRFAVQEAHRLGLEVNMTNDAGWTGSGGPWITPENAMQTVVFSETQVVGDSPVDVVLPQPPTKADFYRDIAVMAVPGTNIPAPLINLKPSLSILTDEGWSRTDFPSEKNPLNISFQNPEKLPSLTIHFDTPFTACVFDLTTVALDGFVDAILQISENGKEYKDLKSFALRNGKNSLVFNTETASYYRIKFLKTHISHNTVDFTNLDVNNRFHIENLPLKAAFMKSGNPFQRAGINETAPPAFIVSKEKVIDLTKYMDTSGRLKWNAPEGKWTILRFGHTFTGAMNGPTAAGADGPECDKLCKTGIRMQFDNMMKKLVELVGPDAKNTLVASHIDSWEVGGQNWTKNMREEFRKRRGYDIVPYLPVLAGKVIGNLQLTERFLWDFRKTISELMVENYLAEMQKLCHENGLRFSFESYNTIGNDLDAANWTDEPMSEFWTRNGGDWYFDKVKEMSSAAHLNNRPVAGAESFTSAEEEKWLLYPANIKAIGDRFFCDGVNRFVVHRYAMQPWLNEKPGMSMGPFGLHYERTQTWWDYSLPWHNYLTRCQYLLRQGTFVSDVLNLQPEEPIYRFRIMKLTGYDYDACSPDAFQHVKVENGKLIDGSGNSHHLLVLTHPEFMTESMLRRIRDLVVRGAVVLGDPPKATPGLTDYPEADARLKVLVNELWGDGSESVLDRKVGKGRVFRNISPEEALNRIGIVPDFVADKKLRYIHRKIDDTDIYFIANSADSAVVANCTFRVTGRHPNWWNPETGQIKALTTYAPTGDGTTRIPLEFGPSGSGFVVFSPETKSDPERVVKITRNGETLLQDGMAITDVNTEKFKGDVFDFLNDRISIPGSYVLTMADGKKVPENFSNEMQAVEVSGPWKLQFPTVNGASKEIQLNQLESWTSIPDKELNYFSGTASYFKTITIPANSIKKGIKLFLDLGKVDVMAKVFVNGKEAGILWKPPYRADITSLVQDGENSLKIDVVNLWVNRMVGDENLPEDCERNPNGTLKQNTWPDWILNDKPSPTGRQSFTTWRLWKKGDPLQESGLLGPVTLQQVKPIL